MIRTNRHRIGFIIALAAASCGLSPVIAQQGEQQDEHPPARFDVDFPGGTLSDYVDAVRKASPDGAANIVVMPEAKGLGVPPIKLVAVTAEAAMQILKGSYTTDDGLRAEVDVSIYRMGFGSDLVMKVVAEVESMFFFSSVWSVEEALVHGQTIEELLEAVEAARSLFSKKAEISYHPPTGLLIARGTNEQLKLLRKVLDQLISGAARRNHDRDSLRERIDELEVERVGATLAMRVAEKELELAKLISKDIVKNTDVWSEKTEAELEVMRAEANRMMSQQELERLLERIARLREALKRYETDRE